MKEVVWVFGTSASGKETFIKNVPDDKLLLEKLGWSNKTLAACLESLEHIGQFKNDPAINLRERILERVPILLNTAEVVLIKWQFVDSEASRPQRLRELTPQAKQRIILLETPKPELVERLAKKGWWHNYGNEESFIEAELVMVADVVKQLIGDFEVAAVDGGTKQS